MAMGSQRGVSRGLDKCCLQPSEELAPSEYSGSLSHTDEEEEEFIEEEEDQEGEESTERKEEGKKFIVCLFVQSFNITKS